MSYFTESPKGNSGNFALHLAVSANGLQWMPLNQNNPRRYPHPWHRRPARPLILRKQDGTFIVMATHLTGTDWTQQSQYIHVRWVNQGCTASQLRVQSGYFTGRP